MSQSSLLFSSVLSLVGLVVAAAERAESDEGFLRLGVGRAGCGREGELDVDVDAGDVGSGADADAEGAGALLVVEVGDAIWDERYLSASGCERGSKRIDVCSSPANLYVVGIETISWRAVLANVVAEA